MIITLIVLFAAGVANFAMHRAFMESDDPQIAMLIRPMAEKVGRHTTYVFEFFLLLGAMSLATWSWFAAMVTYGLYTMFNAMAFSWIMNGPRN